MSTKEDEEKKDRQILTLRQVEDLVGLKRVTLWRLERKRDFPKRLMLTERKVGWREKEVNEWIDKRTADAHRRRIVQL